MSKEKLAILGAGGSGNRIAQKVKAMGMIPLLIGLMDEGMSRATNELKLSLGLRQYPHRKKRMTMFERGAYIQLNHKQRKKRKALRRISNASRKANQAYARAS